MNDILTNEVTNQSEMQVPTEEVVQVNGISNGHHLQQHNSQHSSDHRKSSSTEKHKNKHRDRDRDRHRDSSTHHHSSSSKSTHKSSNRDREKHHGTSSSHGTNDGNGEQQELSSSSSKSKHRSSKHHGSSSKGEDHHRHRHHQSDKSKTDSTSVQKRDEAAHTDATEQSVKGDVTILNQQQSSISATSNSSSSHHHRHHSQSKSSSSSSSKDKERHHHKENSKQGSHHSSHSSSSRKHGSEKTSSSSRSNDSARQHSSSHDKKRHEHDHHRHKSSSSTSGNKHRHSTGSTGSSKSHGHSHSNKSISHQQQEHQQDQQQDHHHHQQQQQQQAESGPYDGEFLRPATTTISSNYNSQQLQNGSLLNEKSTNESDRERQSSENYYACNNRNDFQNNTDAFSSEGRSSYPIVKAEENSALEVSTASSCDYSLSQFKDNEPSFTNKTESLELVGSKGEQISEAKRSVDANDSNGEQSEFEDDENDDNDDTKREIQKIMRTVESVEPSNNYDDEMDPDEEDLPLLKRKIKTEDEDDLPLLARKKLKKESENKTDKKKKRHKDERDDHNSHSSSDKHSLKRKIKVEDEENDYGDDHENENEDGDEDELPLLARTKLNKESKAASSSRKDKKKKRIKEEENEHDASYAATGLTPSKDIKKEETGSTPAKRGKKAKQEEEEAEVWRWWEEEKRDDGVKWTTLEHKGPVFAPPYERLPRNVRFYYDGNPLELTEGTEEAATFYAKMLNHDYCTKDIFNENFFKDFRKVMSSKEREIIKDFRKCNFEEMHQYFVAESEKRKNASKEEKQAKKLENEALIKEYGVCLIDGHKEKIGNFRLEPPGLFRGRGEHPKMGMIKRRIQAEDVSINCGKDSRIPKAPEGHRWREVVHNNTVTWLASWVENVQGQVKYIMLNPSSKLKGEKDHVKYETARRLDKCIETIRNTYRDEWKSKEMRVRQRAVALYFIDKLALRAGNEKDEDQADTVGCCSLRVEHVALHKELNGKEYVVVFDFLGKDSIRYYNEVQVERRVFKNLELFLENKKKGDDLFDRLNTQVLNEHLKELMEGLTAKVFRTYNASITLQNQLDLLTKDDMTVPEKLLAYNRANRAVAILCNHQRSVPKSHEKSMETLKEKIRLKTQAIRDCEAELKDLKKCARNGSVKEKINAEKKAKQLERLQEQLKKLELQETDRDENKTIALGTSKLNYLDPRISVAWCKKHDVPIEKIFNKTQRNKFMWAIHMADKNYRF